jgi:hypothetical protein
MPPQGAAYNADWILSNTSNVHVATDRAWFTSYTPFRTKVSEMPGAEASVDIHGIGTVVLPMRTYRTGKAHRCSSDMTLHNVLYAPHSTINIIAISKIPHLDIQRSRDAVESIVIRGTNKVVGLVVQQTLAKLWLKGQSQNQSSLNPDAHYYIHATWPDEEMAKYNKFAVESKAELERPLSIEEKSFLKRSYGSEFKFLMSYGLSIYDEDDRQEGRSILRALMSDDEQSIESDDFEAELERDPTSHVADYKFSDPQLDYVELHHGNSGNFMRYHGLKFWDEDDCNAAISIVQTLMDDDAAYGI